MTLLYYCSVFIFNGSATTVLKKSHLNYYFNYSNYHYDYFPHFPLSLKMVRPSDFLHIAAVSLPLKSPPCMLLKWSCSCAVLQNIVYHPSHFLY